jgi:hypothetical protein
LTIVGAWFAIILGPKGTAAFSATSTQPAVLLGPNIVNRVGVPAVVTAEAASGPVFLGAATPQDATDAVGEARHEAAIAAEFPARTLKLEGFGGAPLENPSAYHVWRSNGEGTLTVAQDQAPQSVVVFATNGGPVDVTVTYARNTWFLQSLVALVVGLIVLVFAGGWLWHEFRTNPQVGPGDDERELAMVPADAPAVEPGLQSGPEGTAEPITQPLTRTPVAPVAPVEQRTEEDAR